MRTYHSAWNKGRLLGQKPPLKPKEIWSLRIRLQLAEKTRDLALFNLALDSKLRGCDLISLRVRDLYQGNTIASRAIVMQRKTQRPVQFEIWTWLKSVGFPLWTSTSTRMTWHGASISCSCIGF